MSIFGDPNQMKDSFLLQVRGDAPHLLQKHELVGHSFTGLNCIPVVTTLEDLILAEGKFVPTGLNVQNAAVKKVLDWRLASGCMPLVIGEYAGPGSYLHRSQITELLAG